MKKIVLFVSCLAFTLSLSSQSEKVKEKIASLCFNRHLDFKFNKNPYSPDSIRYSDYFKSQYFFSKSNWDYECLGIKVYPFKEYRNLFIVEKRRGIDCKNYRYNKWHTDIDTSIPIVFMKDTGLFKYDTRFLIYYDSVGPYNRFDSEWRFVSGYMKWDDIMYYDQYYKDTFLVNASDAIDIAIQRTAMFDTDNFSTPDCEKEKQPKDSIYITVYCKSKSLGKIAVKIPKKNSSASNDSKLDRLKGYNNYFEMIYYTNDSNILVYGQKGKGVNHWRKVHYKIRNNPESILEWEPAITDIDRKEEYKKNPCDMNNAMNWVLQIDFKNIVKTYTLKEIEEIERKKDKEKEKEDALNIEKKFKKGKKQ